MDFREQFVERIKSQHFNDSFGKEVSLELTVISNEDDHVEFSVEVLSGQVPSIWTRTHFDRSLGYVDLARYCAVVLQDCEDAMVDVHMRLDFLVIVVKR